MLRQKDLSLRAIGVSFVLLVAMTGCDKDDDNMVAERTITETVVANDDFSVLESAVIKANLQATLSSDGPFTVFAPDNAAFTASGISPAVLGSLSPQQVENILLYHALSGKVLAANVPAGPNEKVITANGDSVFVTRNSSGVFVNGIRVEQADINASNGVIHRIEKVLMPAGGDLVATVQTAGLGLDSLVKAVLRASNGAGGDPSLITALQTGRLTVFAPVNAAFTQLLQALGLNDINEVPVPTLVAVLKYHVVPGRAFSPDLANGSLAMLAGGSTTISISGTPSISGSGNAGLKANITNTNIMARNGVVHIIDRVLLP